MTAPPQQQSEDTQQGVDLADLLAAEAAFAAILTALFLAWLAPGPLSLLGNTAKVRQQQITDTFGPALRSFIERSASNFAIASGRPDASVAAAEVAQKAYADIMANVAQWADESYRHIAQDLIGDSDPRAVQFAQDSGERIGRTAAIYAQNETRQQVASRVGFLWKQWRTRHDLKVRETHRELDGQEVPQGGKFVTADGETIAFPGDPDAPIGLIANCRCHLSYHMSPPDRPFVV